MKDKIRRKVIAISKNKHMNRIMGTIVPIIIVLGILLYHRWENSRVLVGLFFSIAISAIILWDCFEIIGQEKEEVLQKNKLVNVILSKAKIWHEILLWGLVVPLTTYLGLGSNFLSIVFWVAIFFIIIVFLSQIFSNFFKKRFIK